MELPGRRDQAVLPRAGNAGASDGPNPSVEVAGQTVRNTAKGEEKMSWWREKWCKYEWNRGSWDLVTGVVLTSWSIGFRIYFEWDVIGFSVDLGPVYFCFSYWR